jgi:hypothetical protein
VNTRTADITNATAEELSTILAHMATDVENEGDTHGEVFGMLARYKDAGAFATLAHALRHSRTLEETARIEIQEYRDRLEQLEADDPDNE